MAGKNPIVAAFLSVVIAGFGQFYLGQFFRGLFFVSLEFVTAFIHLEVSKNIGYILNFLASIWAATDAYRTAKKRDNMQAPPKPERNIYV